MTAPRESAASIRAHLLAIVLFGAILPLALIGFLVTRSAVTSGERLLGTQLDTSLAAVERWASTRWEYRRGNLLLLAENENARASMARLLVTAADSQYFSSLAEAVGPGISSFAYLDRERGEVYSSLGPDLEATNGQAGGGPTLTVEHPVTSAAGEPLGVVEAEIPLSGLVPADSARLLVPGSVLAVRDRARDLVLLPVSPDAPFPNGTSVIIEGERWTVRSVRIEDTPIDVAVAAPLAPYVEPFERPARLGLLAVAAVALLALLTTRFITARLASPMEELVAAAGAVAGGDLTRQAQPSGPTEVRRLASSFNAMTDKLRRLISELSERRALAAVGEFATSLSHEVRNALTAVQIDLERVEERSEDAKNRVMLGRALSHVRRLDAAVTGALRIARSGSIELKDVSLDIILREAVTQVRPAYEAAGTELELAMMEEPLVVKGDADALRHVFLNLLLNAQAWLPRGGRARVCAVVKGDQVTVSIADNGPGMTTEQVTRVFDPYYSTRPGGTGLGLPIARQIALAHGGDLKVRSELGVGTTVEVVLPVAACVPTAPPG
jgi:signal transduction histidine kinase